MNSLIGGSIAACNVHWGYLTIILVYLAFLCYWMVYKKHKDINWVVCAGSTVFFLIVMIMAFFACPICWIFIAIALLLLDVLFGYFLFCSLRKQLAALCKKIKEKTAPFFAKIKAKTDPFFAKIKAKTAPFFAKIKAKTAPFFKKVKEKTVACCKKVKEKTAPFFKKVKEKTVACCKKIKEKTVACAKAVKAKVFKNKKQSTREIVSEVVASTTPVEVIPPAEESAIDESGVSLSESFSIMDALVDQSVVTKLSIVNYLNEKYADKVVLNNRPNRTKNDRLPMADTHYIIVDGKKVCFVYIYQNATGGVLILLKTTKQHYKVIAEKHKGVKRSAFPRRGEWYSVIVDNSYTEAEIFKMLDDSIAISIDPEFIAEPYVYRPTFAVRESVQASEVGSLLSDGDAKSLTVATERIVDRKKKGSINVDLLDQYFTAGEKVTLDEIKKRIPGVDKSMTYCKVLARGKLTKSLIVDLDDYSVPAIKMIILTGGTVITSQK